VKEISKFKKAFLRRLRSDLASPRDDWRRFVLIKVDARDGMSMYPPARCRGDQACRAGGQ